MSTLARTLLLTLLACTLQAPSLAAASGADVLQDCLAGTMKAHYPAADYASALANIPADVGEYTPCAAQITAAQARDAGAQARRLAGNQTAVGASAGAGAAAAAAGSSGTGVSPGAAASTTDGGTLPPTNTTLPEATPQDASASTADGNGSTIGAGMLAALPTGGDDDPGAGGGNGLPAIPIVLAFCVIALSAARALQWWGNRPDDAGAAAGTGPA